MPVTVMNPYMPEALEANRRGELSETQRHGFGALSSDQRRDRLRIAAYLVAGAVLVGLFASPKASPVLRALIPTGCLALATFLVVRSIAGSDALTRDLRQGQVRCVEGAIGKRRLGSGGGRRVTTLVLDVGGMSFKVTPIPFQEAPDAGFVRLYYLPLSRKLVNLERLVNAPLPGEVTPRDLLEPLKASLLAPGMRQRNEARAELAGYGDALEAAFVQSPTAPPPGARDARPLAEAIIGSWNNGLMRVTFSANGVVTTHSLGSQRTGSWSVDGSGRLRSDITGQPESAEAWIAGDRLTIALGGSGMTMTRESGT